MREVGKMDPYTQGMFRENPYFRKRPVDGELVVVLRGRYPRRGLALIPQISRAVRAGEIHELILTAEETGPGRRVEAISYLGFFEVSRGGVLTTGDLVYVNGQGIGRLAGFDETHMPNHLNIVIQSDDGRDGAERELRPGAPVTLTMADLQDL